MKLLKRYQLTEKYTDIGGRLYRSGQSYEDNRVQLGSISSILSDKPPPQLAIQKVDRIVMYPNSDGDYTCDLFWDGPSYSYQAAAKVR